MRLILLLLAIPLAADELTNFGGQCLVQFYGSAPVSGPCRSIDKPEAGYENRFVVAVGLPAHPASRETWVTVRVLPGGGANPRGLYYHFEGVGSIFMAIDDRKIADRLLRANRAERIRQWVSFRPGRVMIEQREDTSGR